MTQELNQSIKVQQNSEYFRVTFYSSTDVSIHGHALRLLLFVSQNSSCLAKHLPKPALPPGVSADPEESPSCPLLSGLSVELSGETQTHFPTFQQAQIFGLQAERPSGNKETTGISPVVDATKC